ncbi:MAG TPA: aminotransferase class IV [Burkholderiaceae bacterium]|nr:aminotransferase class IV [Burkholderiaceae bacterium]
MSDPDFTLFETLRVTTRKAGAQLLARHLQRLQHSAQVLGFAYDEGLVQRTLAQGLAALDGTGPWRLRLDLHKGGQASVRGAPLAALPPGPVGVLLADAPVREVPPALLAHKISWRPAYEAALQAAEAQGAFDMLFFDADGHLTEGARTNVFVRRADGGWVTPPLGPGLLPGVMRAHLLGDPGSPLRQARQVPVTREDVVAARELVVCNALRGALPARLLPPR